MRVRTYGHHISRYHAPSSYNTHRGAGFGSLFRNAFSRISRLSNSPKIRNALRHSKTFLKEKALPASKTVLINAASKVAPVVQQIGKQAIEQAVDLAGEKAAGLIHQAAETAVLKGVPKSVAAALEESALETAGKTLSKGKRKLVDTLEHVASKKILADRLQAATS